VQPGTPCRLTAAALGSRISVTRSRWWASSSTCLPAHRRAWGSLHHAVLRDLEGNRYRRCRVGRCRSKSIAPRPAVLEGRVMGFGRPYTDARPAATTHVVRMRPSVPRHRLTPPARRIARNAFGLELLAKSRANRRTSGPAADTRSAVASTSSSVGSRAATRSMLPPVATTTARKQVAPARAPGAGPCHAACFRFPPGCGRFRGGAADARKGRWLLHKLRALEKAPTAPREVPFGRPRDRVLRGARASVGAVRWVIRQRGRAGEGLCNSLDKLQASGDERMEPLSLLHLPPSSSARRRPD